MKLHSVLWIIGITGAAASGCVWRVEAIARSRAFRWGGCALLAGLLLLLRYRTKTLVRADLLSVIMACIWWLPFAVWFIFQNFGRRRTLRLMDSAKISSNFRGAEAAAKRKDYQEAILLYHRAAAEYPDDPDPRRCMAELFLEAGLPDDAIVSFRDAQKLQREPDDKLLLAFAIADTLVEYKKDVPAAIRVIEDFLARYPDVAGRPFAEGRLQKMRELLAENLARKSSITV
jgi:tetratricopeptide (TPR) repeat protein